MEIVIASSNVHKLRELKDIFKSLNLKHLDILSLHQFPAYEAPEETGSTFEEIAAQKAIHAAQHMSKWVLAEDSGLVVPALGGEPGIYSRRYAGPEATDAENIDKLLTTMANLKEGDRAAYYQCSIAIANPEGIQKTATGICEGHLLRERRGRNGFGYDPLFLKHDYEKTYAEIEDSVKNRISHRRRAVERIVVFLENLRK